MDNCYDSIVGRARLLQICGYLAAVAERMIERATSEYDLSFALIICGSPSSHTDSGCYLQAEQDCHPTRPLTAYQGVSADAMHSCHLHFLCLARWQNCC